MCGKIFWHEKTKCKWDIKRIPKMDFIIQGIIIMLGRLRGLEKPFFWKQWITDGPFWCPLSVWGAVIKKHQQVKFGFHSHRASLHLISRLQDTPQSHVPGDLNHSSLRLLFCGCFPLAFYSPPYFQGPCWRVLMQFWRRMK